MRRRAFITFLAGAAVSRQFSAHAQQTHKLPTIGFLGTDPAAWSEWRAAFEERLRDLGWIAGQTVLIDYQWAEGRRERESEIASEYVRRKVDVIVTTGSIAATLKKATASIPIVFAAATDPLGSDLVSNLSHPGGNVTGLSMQATDIAGKRLELLREVVPSLHRLGVMFDSGYPAAVLERGEVEAAARSLGVEVVPLELRRAEDVAPAFQALKDGADAIYVVTDNLVSANRMAIITFALSKRLPSTFNLGEFVQAGGLMSYGPNFPTLFRRAAEYVDKILRGTKPGEIPVEQPTKFDLTVNLNTARALGLTIPPRLLATADEVFE
jgi:putative tryptophan/tyrosine transport system substrate-binding protein